MPWLYRILIDTKFMIRARIQAAISRGSASVRCSPTSVSELRIPQSCVLRVCEVPHSPHLAVLCSGSVLQWAVGLFCLTLITT